MKKRRRRNDRKERSMTAQSETILEVVAAKICRGDTFLLCQRAATKSRPLMWEFVGGKVEPGETREQALRRECREELGVSPIVHEPLIDVTHVYPDITIHLTLFRAETDDEPQKLEHHDIRWITEAQLDGYALCPADAEMVALLQKTTQA